MDISLDNLKDEMIEKVISTLVDTRYMSKQEKINYEEDLRTRLKEKALVTTLRTQSDITNAYDYNQTAYELYLDMVTTFEYLNRLYDTINRHQLLNESIINTLHSNIATLNDKLDECESILGIIGGPRCYIEGFRTQNNQSWDSKYYTERYGELMPLETYACFNGEQENITLNYTRQQNVMVYKSGVQLGEISITRQYGSGFIRVRNSESKLENAIDTSLSSYWSETILADAEMKVNGLGYQDVDGIGTLNRSFYDLPRGALCEICLNFESLAKINELVLKPFGNFPIDIVAIRYSLTDDDTEDIYDVVYPNNSLMPWLSTTSINKEHAFHFPQITCKRLYILINQLHCIKNTYLLSCNQMFKNELWFNATYNQNKGIKMDNSTVFVPMYLDRAQEDNVWQYINDKISTNKNIDINNMLINNNNKIIPVTKYQYTYGFYNIAPNFVEFQKAGVWVSQEIVSDGPISTITLESDEEHFVADDGYIATDIEFYVTTKDNPSYKDWHPICPMNKDYVYKELLQLDYEYCYLRHTAVCGKTITQDVNGNAIEEYDRPIVYMNDIVLIENADYQLILDEYGNAIAVEIPNIDLFALYTVSYRPTDSSKEVCIVDTNSSNPLPSSAFEEFMGDGTGCYRLSGYPYYSQITPELTSTSMRIIDVDTGEMFYQMDTPESAIQCVTNKDHPSDSYKNFVANSGKIQYYTNGRYLYFNKPLKPTQKIEFNYPAFDSKVRLKVILRRNHKKNNWITPVLKGYKLMFTTV